MHTIGSDVAAYGQQAPAPTAHPSPAMRRWRERTETVQALTGELSAAAAAGRIDEGAAGRTTGRAIAEPVLGGRVHTPGPLRDLVGTLTMLVRLQALADAAPSTADSAGWGDRPGALHGAFRVEIAQLTDRIALEMGDTI